MSLIHRVRQFIRDHELIRPDTRVVAALSGGSDSVALTSILRALHAHGDVCLAGLAHFNHQLRPTADRDERLAMSIAAAIDVPILVDREDVAARARAEHRSIEDAGRAARYAFFARARDRFHADLVALGHTRDDQAETFLLRLVRGAGPRGLAAMYPRHEWVVRPLLCCGREELRGWLATRRLEGDRATEYVDDESNADVRIPRNRIRAALIPLLKDRFNPAIVDVLASEAEMARETWDWLQAEADATAVRIVRREGDARAIDLEELKRLPAALRRVVMWRVMTEVARDRAVGFDHVTAALRVAATGGPSAIDAPGQRVERIGSRVVLTGRPLDAIGRWAHANAQNLADSANLFRYPLSIPGEVELPQGRCVVSARELDGAERERAAIDSRAIVGNGPVAVVRRDLCRGSLAVRNRRPGDRFRPVGLNGKKKLQDFFVDRKIARRERDRVPLIVDGSDRIVWVAGYGIDEAFQVTDPAQHVLILELSQARQGAGHI